MVPRNTEGGFIAFSEKNMLGAGMSERSRFWHAQQHISANTFETLPYSTNLLLACGGANDFFWSTWQTEAQRQAEEQDK